MSFRSLTLAAVAASLSFVVTGCAEGGGTTPSTPNTGASALQSNVQTAASASHATTVFKGAKVNGGFVTHTTNGTKSLLTLSTDFKVPDTPAPHWQVVDSRGNTYLLQRLVIKGDKFNQTIEVPSYVPDVAKVQIWCAWAEALLGEASFASPVH